MSRKCQKHKPYTYKDKWIVSIMGGLLFLLLASPVLYSIVNSTTSSFGLITANNGCPNISGLLLHGFLFALIIRLLMR